MKKHRRTIEIEEACNKAKERDSFRCIVPGCTIFEFGHVIASHLVKRNCSMKRNNPANPIFIMTLCWVHDAAYDPLSGMRERIDWLQRERLLEEAEKVKYIYGERDFDLVWEKVK